MCPHPFTWVPAEGHRHASRDDVPSPAREFPPDMSVMALCGRQITTATGDVAWFWPTCFDCDERARTLAGLPSREARTPRSDNTAHTTGDPANPEHHTGGDV